MLRCATGSRPVARAGLQPHVPAQRGWGHRRTRHGFPPHFQPGPSGRLRPTRASRSSRRTGLRSQQGCRLTSSGAGHSSRARGRKRAPRTRGGNDPTTRGDRPPAERRTARAVAEPLRREGGAGRVRVRGVRAGRKSTSLRRRRVTYFLFVVGERRERKARGAAAVATSAAVPQREHPSVRPVPSAASSVSRVRLAGQRLGLGGGRGWVWGLGQGLGRVRGRGLVWGRSPFGPRAGAGAWVSALLLAGVWVWSGWGSGLGRVGFGVRLGSEPRSEPPALHRGVGLNRARGWGRALTG